LLFVDILYQRWPDFWSRVKFDNYFSLWAAQFKISDDKVTISEKQKIFGPFHAFIDSFWKNFYYVAFSQNRKRSKGRKNKSEGLTLAMSVLYSHISKKLIKYRKQMKIQILVDDYSKLSNMVNKININVKSLKSFQKLLNYILT